MGALVRDQYGSTALMRAADSGSAERVAALLAVDDIDVNVQNEVRHSVRHTAQHQRTASMPRARVVVAARHGGVARNVW